MFFCMVIHYLALKTWFSGDDFAWLGLWREVATYHDWLDVLFGPRAQGTIRTVSERIYFLTFSGLFGLNAVPFRIWVFLTQFVNLALINGITRRLTGSKLAGFMAPILWSACAGLAISLDWSSAYNEICCSMLLLLSFYFLLRYIDTNERKYWIWQWITFLIAFGALELIVTYPAVAALYTLLFARRYFSRTLWLFIPSLAFTVFHFVYVPKAVDPNYTMHFSPGILRMLGRYWAFTTGAYRMERVDWRPEWLGLALSLLIAAGAVALLVRRTKLALFFLGWFVIVLLPVLPLTEHFSEYYVTVPAIGLAMLGGWAIAVHPKIAGALGLAFLVVSICDLQIAENYYYQRARKMKRLITGLQAVQPSFQGKKVLLSGVDSDFFWSGFFDDPFRLIGINEIYLAPGTEKIIDPHPEWGGIGRFVIALEPALSAVKRNEAVVFSVAADGVIHDATRGYDTIASAQYLAEHRDQVDVGDPLYSSRLGEGWFKSENGFRWMGKSATIQLSGPDVPGKKLVVSGYCPASVVSKGPVELTVTASGHKLGRETLRVPDQKFELAFPLPSSVTGMYAMPVTLDVNRTTKIGSDQRALGLIFGTFRMKP